MITTPPVSGKPGQAPGATITERSAETLGGDLGLTITTTGSSNTVSLPIADLHGDVITQTTLPAGTGNCTGIDSWSDTDEYGNPLSAPAATSSGETPTNADGTGAAYGWLGAKQRATDSTGLLLMGARIYDPVTGAFSSPDAVYGGNTTAYIYPQDPINSYDLDGLRHRRFWRCFKAVGRFFSARDDINAGWHASHLHFRRAIHDEWGAAPSHGASFAAKHSNGRWGRYGKHSHRTGLGRFGKFGLRHGARLFGWPVTLGATAWDYGTHGQDGHHDGRPGEAPYVRRYHHGGSRNYRHSRHGWNV